MTDTGNEERPLTRRELRARERAAAAAEANAAAQEDGAAPADAGPAVDAEATLSTEEAAPAADSSAEADPAPDYTSLPPAQAEGPADAEEQSAPLADSTLNDEGQDEIEETQAYTIDDLRETGLIAEEQVAAPEAAEPAADAAPAVEEAPAPAAEEEAPSAKRGIGRFFGRRSRPETAEEPAADFDSLIASDSAPGDDEAAEPEADGGIEDLQFDQPEQPAGEAEAGEAQPEADELVEAEVVQDDPAVAPSVEPAADPAAETQEVAGPARASGSRYVPLDEGQNLDEVRDEDVDSVEIDEVQVDERRVSARTVSDSTPLQMEDTRGASFENDGEQPSGPSRGRGGRLPFVVNVVEDTSEHHISDLHRGRENVEGKNVGTGSSSITANALVLPATGQEDQIQFESEDGVLVTGSIDLPDGFASSGRARGAFDSSDIDTSSDSSEVSNPETQPVRASRAVSSYANARVSIAPKRQSRSALPWALGIGGGVVFGAIVVVAVGFVVGWF